MKKIIVALLILLGTSVAQIMETYCCAPPYVMATAKPNILFVMDVTGSMTARAAHSYNNGFYDQAQKYYGYFVDSVDYWYRNNVFYPDGHQPGGSSGPFPGNIMNWAVMSRIDVLRKVISGGKGGPASQFPKNQLNAEGTGWASYGWADSCRICVQVGSNVYTYTFNKGNLTRIDISRRTGNPYNLPDTVTLSALIPTGNGWRCNIDIPDASYMGQGVIRQIADKNLDTDFDDDAPRIGLFFFSTSTFDIAREFWESDGSAAASAEAFIDDINNTPAGGATPVGKAVFESVCYLAWVRDYYNGYQRSTSAQKDPYNNPNGDTVWCRKSFVIMMGDGLSNSDSPYVTSYSQLPAGPFPRPLYDYDADGNRGDWCSASPHHPADDYAYYGHITDIRPDIEDEQKIEFYSIYCFGPEEGKDLFKEIAKDGGFVDKNSDNIPQLDEYDEDGDSIPDHYYDAVDGHQLEAAILEIIEQIMANVSSSSGVSVVTTGSKSAGVTVQSQFYPKRYFLTGEKVDWIGTCQSLWLDPFGLLREDTDSDAHLNLLQDQVITMGWDGTNVVVFRYNDVLGNGDSLELVDSCQVEELRSVWDAGCSLHVRSATDRLIRAFVDLDGDRTVDLPTEYIDFTETFASTYTPYLGVPTDSTAEVVINYVRGTDYPGLRPRIAGGNVWKLSDIINSGAVSIQGAIERYDFVYGDQSYIQYYDMCENRRQAVYVGANDGMLHCFNGGFPTELTGNAYIPMMLDPGAPYTLGQEMWAHIPHNTLPHLKWLKELSYCHVYYCDLKVYATDAQIFANDAQHPNGWGTILVGGMRLGGMPIVNGVDTCRSSYYALDVTDPVNPVPLWEFTSDYLGLTVCYSCVIKVDSSWFLVFGSGPETCSGETVENARVYVLDLATGDSVYSWVVPDAGSFVTNIFGADWGMDYTVDRIYFGTCERDNSLPGDWGGKVYRIETHDDTDPSTWTMSMVFDMERPVTAEGSISTDDYNHLWVYFGSGRFFSELDEIDFTVQRYIGIREDTTRATTVAGLLDVTDVEVDTLDVVHTPWGTTTFDALVDTVNEIGGWYRDLEGQGERTLTTSLVFGGAVLFTSFLPSGGVCSYGGAGNLYALYYRTGTAFTSAFLKSDTSVYHPISVDLGQGMPSEPALYVSADQTKVFIQAGGGIVSPETGIPGLPRSGVIIWKGR
jgi:type IV pilus assembly protein PilY1